MRATQRSRLLDLLRSRRGQWIPLPEILALGFSQFGARLLELRRSGLTILNKTEHRNGKTFSWYRLEDQPGCRTETARYERPTLHVGDYNHTSIPRIQGFDSPLVPIGSNERGVGGPDLPLSSPIGDNLSLFGDLALDRTYQE